MTSKLTFFKIKKKQRHAAGHKTASNISALQTKAAFKQASA